MAKKKYYKVVVLVPEVVQTYKKVAHVNVKKCVVDGKKGAIYVYNYIGNKCGVYPINFDFFMKEQKGWIDDGTGFNKKGKKKKTKVA